MLKPKAMPFLGPKDLLKSHDHAYVMIVQGRLGAVEQRLRWDLDGHQYWYGSLRLTPKGFGGVHDPLDAGSRRARSSS